MADDRKPYEIEREIEIERAQLAASLDALTDKLSPDAMVRSVTDQVQRHGGEFSANLMRTVKNNPTAAILAGAGIAWLMASSGKRERVVEHDRFSRRASLDGGPYVDSDYDDDVETVGLIGSSSDDAYDDGDGTDGPYSAARTPTYASGASEGGSRYPSGGRVGYARTDSRPTARGFADTYPADDFTARVSAADRAMRAGERGTTGYYEYDEDEGSSLAAKAQGIWERASMSVQNGWQSAIARASDLRDNLMEGTEGMDTEGQDRVARARATAYAAQAKAEMMARRARREASGFFYEQPLVTGALAIAAGAAIGAALPRTRREDEAFGAYRDQLFEEAERVYSEERARLEAGASAALREAKQVAVDAKEQITGGMDGEETVHEAESKARGAVQRISDAAKDAASKPT